VVEKLELPNYFLPKEGFWGR